ncbi:MAG: glycosyltransferase [Pseudoflavonifractor sp.]
MTQYICLSPEPWSAIPSRTQQLMARLRDTEILFFEPSTPNTKSNYKKPGRKMRPGLTVYTLPPIPAVEERYHWLFHRGQRKLSRFIAAQAERHRFQEPILWCTSPDQVHLLDLLPHRAVVYDCDRDWTGLPLRWESDLVLAAEVVFAASPGLAGRLAPCSDNIALLPGGVNFPMFSREDFSVPDALDSLKVPVLGYEGTLWRDLDLNPVLSAARDMPGCAFVFVGQVKDNPLLSPLRALPNVIFLGQKPLADLPDYLARFDVCLNLLRHSQSGSDVIPGRIYEYLSTGKPIVSMLAEEHVEVFPDVIYSAHTAAEFSQLCARALTEVGDWAKIRRREYGEGAAWSLRADEVCRILETIGLY